MDPNEKTDPGASWEAAFGENGILTPFKGNNVREEGEDTHRERGHFRWALKGTICLGLNRKKMTGVSSILSRTPLFMSEICW